MSKDLRIPIKDSFVVDRLDLILTKILVFEVCIVERVRGRKSVISYCKDSLVQGCCDDCYRTANSKFYTTVLNVRIEQSILYCSG